jgi:hypothetical protein
MVEAPNIACSSVSDVPSSSMTRNRLVLTRAPRGAVANTLQQAFCSQIDSSEASCWISPELARSSFTTWQHTSALRIWHGRAMGRAFTPFNIALENSGRAQSLVIPSQAA